MTELKIRLFVDDIRREPEGWQRARTVTEAIRILANMDVSEVSLDHDIADYCPGCRREFSSDETFEPVAYYIATMNPRPIVQIHTGNPGGAARMADILGMEYGPGSNLPGSDFEGAFMVEWQTRTP